MLSGSCALHHAGSFQPFVDAFVGMLGARQYTPLTVCGYENSARHFAHWLYRCHIELRRVNEDVIGASHSTDAVVPAPGGSIAFRPDTFAGCADLSGFLWTVMCCPQ